MKKRWLTMLSAATLCTVLFAGCSNETPETETEKTGESTEQGGAENTDGEKETLKLAVFEGGYGKAFWEEVVSRFEADYPNVTVELTASPKIADVVRPQLAAGTTPDLIYYASSQQGGIVQALVKDRKLADLTDVFEQPAPGESTPIKDKILSGFLETDLVAPYGDGTPYLAPFYYNVTGVWYDSALFTEKGWEAPTTWDEFFDLGDEAKEDGISLFTYQGMAPGYMEALIWPAIAGAAGQEAVDAILNYEDGAWENEKVIKALEVIGKIATDDYLLPGTVAMTHTQAQTEHLKGSALFLPNGNWYETEMVDAIQPDWEWGFMTSPTFNEGETRYVLTGIEEIYIPSDAENVELAKEFMRYLYKDEIVALNAELSKGIVPIEGAVEMAKDFIPESNYSCFQVLNEENVAILPVRFATAENTEINMSDELFKPVSSVMNKELSAKEWAANLEAASDKVRESQN